MASDDQYLTPEFAFMGKEFADPFLLNSNLYIPKDFYTALEFALYLAIHNPIYTQVTKRTVSHFLTEITFVGDSGDNRERDDLNEYLTDELKVLDALQQAGMEMFIYGNSFARIHYPFNRFLVDRRNGGYREYALGMFKEDIEFDLETLTYSVPDPLAVDTVDGARPRVNLEFADRKSKTPERLSIHFLNPTRMMINMNHISGTCEYVYRFEEFFRAAVRNGKPIHQINETPMDMLIALRNDQDFKFNPGSIYHFKNPFISGISYNGWGIPNILLNYSNLHMMAVYRKINEAIGLDYMTPFRLISPAPSSSQGGADVAMATNLGPWRAAMSQLIAHKRKDPTALHTVPFPVTYQELGANGKALAPVDLMQYQQDTTLDGFGYAAEMFKGSMQLQALPTALRQFQSQFIYLYRAFNGFLKWACNNVQDYLERERVNAKLAPPSIADNIESMAIKMQLVAGGEISRKTAYSLFGINNPIEEADKRAREDIEIQKAQMKRQQEFERQQTIGSASQVVDAMLQSQGPPPGMAPGGPGMPPGGGGGAPMGGGGVTPLDVQEQAAQEAQQLLQIQDDGERSKALRQIKATNPTLHAVVKEKMEEIRAQGASQGRKSVGQGPPA